MERSIINCCQINRQGVARPEIYFDPNVRKYFISPRSVEWFFENRLTRIVYQVRHGGRVAYEQNLFASASFTNSTLTGSNITRRFSASAMPPVNSARIVYAATA